MTLCEHCRSELSERTYCARCERQIARVLGHQPPQNVRMIERVDGTGYRKVTMSEYLGMASRLRLEGVDGDEQANTVTYWYARSTEEQLP